MREYELTVVYDLAVQEAGGPDAPVQQITTLVESRGGKMLKVDHWGRRRMAYPINRAIDGDYVVTRIELDPNGVAPLEATLRIDERVYRHLVVRADELPAPLPPREPRQPFGAQAAAPAAPAEAPAAATADATGVAEAPATPEAAADLGAAEASPAPVPAAPGEDTEEGEAPASGTIAETPAMEVSTSTTPQSSTTGFDSDAAAVNSGIPSEDENKPTGPHTEQDA